ncbi:MAG: ABC transporter ATP-binding protein [Thermoplasmata archaeon]
MTSPLLEARELWKSYDGHVQVLQGADLQLAEGEGILVWGRNGSGKTTLLNLLGCLDLPDEGSILLEGRDVTALSSRERARIRLRRIGFIFQDHNLLEELTVRQNVLLPMKLSRLPVAEERVDDLLSRFGLEELAGRRPGGISMGESQKAAIARALANRPSLLLADEPTASLDEDSAQDLLGLLEGLRRGGRAVVLASHDPLAMEMGWRRLKLQGGRLRPL